MWGVGVNEPLPVVNLYPPVQSGDPDWRSYYTVNLLNLPATITTAASGRSSAACGCASSTGWGCYDVACREMLKLAQLNRLGKNQEWEFNEWFHSRTGRTDGQVLPGLVRRQLHSRLPGTADQPRRAWRLPMSVRRWILVSTSSRACSPDAARRRALPSPHAGGRLDSALARDLDHSLQDLFTGFKAGEPASGLRRHLGTNGWCSSTSSACCSASRSSRDHFEESELPKVLPRFLPDDWKGGFVAAGAGLRAVGFLDNIAAALIGGTMAATAVPRKVHIGYLAAIVAASNAGGAGSVVGDTTTTMMWIDGVSAGRDSTPTSPPSSRSSSSVSGRAPAARVLSRSRRTPRGLHIDWARMGIVGLHPRRGDRDQRLRQPEVPEHADASPSSASPSGPRSSCAPPAAAARVAAPAGRFQGQRCSCCRSCRALR
jgi:hypothetical protein